MGFRVEASTSPKETVERHSNKCKGVRRSAPAAKAAKSGTVKSERAKSQSVKRETVKLESGVGNTAPGEPASTVSVLSDDSDSQ